MCLHTHTCTLACKRKCTHTYKETHLSIQQSNIFYSCSVMALTQFPVLSVSAVGDGLESTSGSDCLLCYFPGQRSGSTLFSLCLISMFSPPQGFCMKMGDAVWMGLNILRCCAGISGTNEYGQQYQPSVLLHWLWVVKTWGSVRKT